MKKNRGMCFGMLIGDAPRVAFSRRLAKVLCAAAGVRDLLRGRVFLLSFFAFCFFPDAPEQNGPGAWPGTYSAFLNRL